MSPQPSEPVTNHISRTTYGVSVDGQGKVTIEGDVNVDASTPAPEPAAPVSPEQVERLQAVVVQVVRAGLWQQEAIRTALRDIQAAVEAGPVEPGVIRRLLGRVEDHAGTAGAVLAAVQVAQVAFGA